MEASTSVYPHLKHELLKRLSNAVHLVLFAKYVNISLVPSVLRGKKKRHVCQQRNLSRASRRKAFHDISQCCHPITSPQKGGSVSWRLGTEVLLAMICSTTNLPSNKASHQDFVLAFRRLEGRQEDKNDSPQHTIPQHTRPARRAKNS